MAKRFFKTHKVSSSGNTINCPVCKSPMKRLPKWTDNCDLLTCENAFCQRFHYGVPVKPGEVVIRTRFPSLFADYGKIETVEKVEEATPLAAQPF